MKLSFLPTQAVKEPALHHRAQADYDGKLAQMNLINQKAFFCRSRTALCCSSFSHCTHRHHQTQRADSRRNTPVISMAIIQGLGLGLFPFVLPVPEAGRRVVDELTGQSQCY